MTRATIAHAVTSVAREVAYDYLICGGTRGAAHSKLRRRRYLTSYCNTLSKQNVTRARAREMSANRSGKQRVVVVEAPRASLGIETRVCIVAFVGSEIRGEVVTLNGVTCAMPS